MPSVIVKGYDRIVEKLGGDRLLREPFKKFFERVGATVQGQARILSPVDTGRLRGSIAYKVDDASLPLFVEIGSAVEYAPYMEYGTGLLTDGEGGVGGAHFPPGAALNTWGQRHGGASGHAIARAIGLAGGLRPRRYLRGGVQNSLTAIRGFVGRLGKDIKDLWDRK